MRRDNEQSAEQEFQRGQLTAYCEIAKALHVLQGELTSRLESVFRAPASGQVLGSLDRMPSLRRAYTKRGKSPRPLALASDTHIDLSPAKKVKRPKNVGGSWWYKLSVAEKKAVIAKRVAATKASKEGKASGLKI